MNLKINNSITLLIALVGTKCHNFTISLYKKRVKIRVFLITKNNYYKKKNKINCFIIPYR